MTDATTSILATDLVSIFGEDYFLEINR